QPAFHRSSIAAFASLMVERTRALLKDWDGPARFGRPVNVYHEMRRLSLDVVTRALFGVNVHEDARLAGHTFAILSEALAEHMFSPFFPLFLHPVPPTRGSRRARAALRTLDRIVGSIIARRRAQGSAADEDLLSLLLHARDEETDGAGMDDRQIRDEVMTVLLAGHETTAATLSWAWYLLGRQPDLAERLRSELSRRARGPRPDCRGPPAARGGHASDRRGDASLSASLDHHTSREGGGRDRWLSSRAADGRDAEPVPDPSLEGALARARAVRPRSIHRRT